MKLKDQQFLFNIARLAAEQSTAIRLKVGGVVTDSDGNIIAYAYNGTVHGADNDCEHHIYQEDDVASGIIKEEYEYDMLDFNDVPYRLETKSTTVHCEANLIAHAARRGISVNNGKMFLTHSPCERCSSLIVQSGIKEVHFLEKFRTYDKVLNIFSKHIDFKQWG